jgi:hypothetical protein
VQKPLQRVKNRPNCHPTDTDTDTAMQPHAINGSTPDEQADLADLDSLARELGHHGLTAELCTPPGKLPYLHVSNPQASALTERVYAQAGAFWFSWAERITGCDEPATAAATLAHVLSTAPTPG